MTTELGTTYPWDTEIVPVTWEAHGLTCHVLRGLGGQLNGYVRIPKDHPLHGHAYNDELPDWMQKAWEERQQQPIGDGLSPFRVLCLSLGGSVCVSDPVNVHGGVTFSGEGGKQLPEGFWWGFDCAHAGDFLPKYYKDHGFSEGEIYRDLAYVKAQAEGMAEQLQALAS